MSKMGEKVAYLKGLAEGMRLDAGSDQGKLLLAMIDAMEAFASEHEDTCAQLDELQQYVEEIDSDVSDLEEALFSEDEDDEEDEDDGEDDDDEDGDGLIEYECPHCGTVVFFDEEAFDMEDKHLCPNCHRSIFDDEDSFDEDDNAEGDDDGEDE